MFTRIVFVDCPKGHEFGLRALDVAALKEVRCIYCGRVSKINRGKYDQTKLRQKDEEGKA